MFNPWANEPRYVPISEVESKALAEPEDKESE